MGITTSILVTSNEDEDYQFIIDSLNRQNGLNIIGVENDETGAIINTERLKPDVLILDLLKPAMDGTELAPIIRRKSPSTAIIMICDKDDNEYAGKALRAGISGFLLRKSDMNKLFYVVRIVNLGGYYISTSIIKRTLNSNRINNKKENSHFFSPIERCIINKIAQGVPDAEIAVHLNYSAGTVKNRLTAIKRKTKLKNRLEIVVFSLVRGLIDLEQLDLRLKKE